MSNCEIQIAITQRGRSLPPPFINGQAGTERTLTLKDLARVLNAGRGFPVKGQMDPTQKASQKEWMVPGQIHRKQQHSSFLDLWAITGKSAVSRKTRECPVGSPARRPSMTCTQLFLLTPASHKSLWSARLLPSWQSEQRPSYGWQERNKWAEMGFKGDQEGLSSSCSIGVVITWQVGFSDSWMLVLRINLELPSSLLMGTRPE